MFQYRSLSTAFSNRKDKTLARPYYNVFIWVEATYSCRQNNHFEAKVGQRPEHHISKCDACKENYAIMSKSILRPDTLLEQSTYFVKNFIFEINKSPDVLQSGELIHVNNHCTNLGFEWSSHNRRPVNWPNRFFINFPAWIHSTSSSIHWQQKPPWRRLKTTIL